MNGERPRVSVTFLWTFTVDVWITVRYLHTGCYEWVEDKRKGTENADEYVGSVHNGETGFKPSFLSYAETKPLLFNFKMLMRLYLAVCYGVSLRKMVMWFLFAFAIFLIMELVGLYPCNFSIIVFALPILCWRGVFCIFVFPPPLSHLLCDTSPIFICILLISLSLSIEFYTRLSQNTRY